jgi:recombination protein RecR
MLSVRMSYPKALDELALSLKQLPGVGQRGAERLALALLDWDEQRLQQLGEQVTHLRERVHPCEVCGNLADEDRCRICLDPSREADVICVLEDARQVIAIERCGRFRGTYHVLGGKLSPLDGVDFDDLNTASLLTRLRAGSIREIILATSPDVEGGATAAYLIEALAEFDLEITRIATGVPVGSDLSFADSATMAMAIDSRRKV